MTMIEDLTLLLNQVLQPQPDFIMADANVPLLGSLPELDSMSVVAVLTALEERYGFVVEDGDITGEIFLTLGDLTDFVEAKIAESARESTLLAVGD